MCASSSKCPSSFKRVLGFPYGYLRSSKVSPLQDQIVLTTTALLAKQVRQLVQHCTQDWQTPGLKHLLSAQRGKLQAVLASVQECSKTTHDKLLRRLDQLVAGTNLIVMVNIHGTILYKYTAIAVPYRTVGNNSPQNPSRDRLIKKRHTNARAIKHQVPRSTISETPKDCRST